MSEPVVIAESLPFISRSQLVKLARPRFETIRDAAALLWAACRRLRLPAQSYTTAVLYVHRFLVLNPEILSRVEADTAADSKNGGAHDAGLGLREASCACLVTAFLTEGPAKKIDDAAATLNVAPDRVISLQREVLETNAFDFRVQTVPSWVVKHAKTQALAKEVALHAYEIALDAYETTAVVQFPAHQVAAACIDVAVRDLDGAKAAVHWDMAKFGLRVVAVRTSTRLLLEFYDRCNRNMLGTHAKLHRIPDLQRWLGSLQKSAPPLESHVTVPMVHDPQITRDGTARYRAKQDA